ncbi:class I SAM-dependent methyltransferase [Streptomyces sp. NPDC096339]|uniref:class I SAM-dependent methyltransferase n=1 Tax=Streptomyces sp. NPDC096339 TaxID=3366086 RepID=UPI00380C6DAA
MRPAADRLAELLGHFLPGPLPVRLRAWDGSQAGPADAPLVVLRSPGVLRRMLWQPGELGLAEAYVTGELDVEGDLADALSRAGRAVRDRPPVRPRPASLAAAASLAVRLGAAGPPPQRPDGRARLTGPLHSASTIDAWRATLERRWSDVADLVGQTTARVWRLYLAGASLAFAERRMGVDQILAVRPTREGASAMPATPADWYPPVRPS